MRKTTLGEYADVVAGVSYNPADIALQGVRILRGGNIQNGEIVLKQDDVFLDLKYKSSVNQVHCGDTIVVASTGSTDALGKAATSWCDITETQIGAFLRIVRPKERKYAALVSAWLTQPIFSSYIVNKAKGTGINNIRREHLLDYKIEVPDDDRLAEFSALYEAVESKITLNRKKIEKLEALAKTIYDYWFVQFDFPDANGCPYKSSGGKMVYNPILKREIPDGWDIKRLGECLAPIPKTNRVSTNGYLKKGAIPIIDQEVGSYIVGYTDDEYACLKLGSCIVFGDHSCSVKYVNFDFARGADGTQIINSRIPRVLDNFQIYFYLKGIKFDAGYKRHFYDLKQRYISISNDVNLVEQFQTMSHAIFLQIKELTVGNIRLGVLRDFLLPLLMNGQVEVGE